MSDLAGIRVLKAHTDAVATVGREFLTLAKAGQKDAATLLMAEAVLTATDAKTRFVVGVRTSSASALIYGPYATFAAAEKAIETGAVGTHSDDVAGIWPLIPAPKASRKARP